LISLATAAVSNWLPTFLLRSYGMNLKEVGGWYGATSIIGAMAGLVTGGLLVSRLMRRDPSWELWVPACAYTICVPLVVLMVLSPQWWMVVLLHVVSSFFTAIGSSASFAAVQGFAEPRRRGTAIALMGFCSALLGAGGGPYAVGLLTDVFGPQFGRDGLRYAILASQAALLPGIMCYVLAGLRSAKDRVA
jgi:MFS family permease